MQFIDLATAYERLEATSKRLEMRAILADLIRPLRPPDLGRVLFLSQGVLRPEYEGIELGVATSLARRAVATATGTDPEEVAKRTQSSGDLGTTAGELIQRLSRLDSENPLSVANVYSELVRIAAASGPGSQEVKVEALVRLLGRARPLEAKYLVRFVIGTLRVGVREMTILDALTDAFADGSKEARVRIESAFNLTSDLALVAEALVTGGVGGLEKIRLEVGRPVRPMLAEREPTLAAILERMGGTAALEYKYDGLRVQAHVGEHGEVRLFSRRLEEISAQFPELRTALPAAVRSVPAILEGECVPIDPDTDEIRPFQEVSRRRGRKHDLERLQQEVPVCLFLFDVLLADGKVVYDRPFPDRRKLLTEMLRPSERVRVADQRVVHSVEEATAFFEEALAGGAEGVVAKSLQPGSGYRAGARGFWWIKYKRDYTAGLSDSIDGVVVGGFHGRGRRAGRFGAYLLAVYNPDQDRFESFCKVGSGFDDAALAEMPTRLRALHVTEAPPGVVSGIVPDQWFRPKVVLEVRGAELTLSPIHRAAQDAVRPGAGLALRFPRFTGRVRDDKGPTEATTSTELLKMYRSQVRQATPTDAAASADAE
ncbi:MAG TPA: ATP-dependent DNA ligase [Thermoplasmata archaeon]|nr:ATP-dependent DNA ligase [Thermoplasmata archaeon]